MTGDDMSPRQKLTLGILAVVLWGGCLSVHLPEVSVKPGSETEKLTWDSLVRQTIAENPDLAGARYGITSRARSRDQAFGSYLPSVSGNFDRNRQRTTGTDPMKDDMAFGITGDQPMFTGLNTTGQFLKAGKDLEATRWAYQVTSANVRFQLRSVYIELLKLDQLLAVNRRIAERRKQNAEMIRLRYNAGRENLGSAMRGDAIAEQAEFNVRQTMRRMESQSLLLGKVVGGDFVVPAKVEGEMEKIIPAPDDETPDYPGLAEQTPTVYQLTKTAEAFKAAVISAQSVIWPQVNGSLDYGYEGGKLQHLRDQFLLGMTVTLPFFNGGKNIEGILKAKADYQTSLEAAESARNSAVAQLADAWVQLQDARENVVVNKHFLEAGRKRAEIIRAEYASGLVDFQEFDITEQDFANAETAYVQSLADVLTKAANWEFVKGSTLEDVLHETRS
ncbi:MAG: TolC family protein [Candidatus Omnitrophica bacterium]|nr:TolC family protein [Candidatus Omnitrophota bacterium]MDD5671364.1 TolC family protein [Candidatus Omnitrophota bacterium]